MTVFKEFLKILLAAIMLVCAAIVTFFLIARPQGLLVEQLIATGGTCFVYLAAVVTTAWALGKFKKKEGQSVRKKTTNQVC